MKTTSGSTVKDMKASMKNVKGDEKAMSKKTERWEKEKVEADERVNMKERNREMKWAKGEKGKFNEIKEKTKKDEIGKSS